MYLLALIVTALAVLSVFSSNWPVKWYHFHLLNQLAREFAATPIKYGMILSTSFAEIRPQIMGKDFVIRFIEGASGSLRAESGLEIRMRKQFPMIMEFYRMPTSKREWGEFKKWVTGDPTLDSQWLILTPRPQEAQSFWNRGKLPGIIMDNHQIDQILLTPDEMILRLRRFGSVGRIREIVKKMAEGS
jgi:hypothetical protein